MIHFTSFCCWNFKRTTTKSFLVVWQEAFFYKTTIFKHKQRCSLSETNGHNFNKRSPDLWKKVNNYLPRIYKQTKVPRPIWNSLLLLEQQKVFLVSWRRQIEESSKFESLILCVIPSTNFVRTLKKMIIFSPTLNFGVATQKRCLLQVRRNQFFSKKDATPSWSARFSSRSRFVC